MNTLMYVVYGQTMFCLEAVYSLISAFHFLPPDNGRVRYVIYTDSPGLFERLGVEIVTLTAEQMNGWKGPNDYHHRIKMLAHVDALQQFGGNVVLVDTDTYFLKSPERLFSRIGRGRSVLHVRESRLSEVKDARYAAFAAILADGSLTDSSGVPLPFEADAVMWNSGVIGVNQADVDSITAAVDLVDQFKQHPRSKGIHQIEQFATGYFLARRTEVRAASDVVFHYWYHDLKDPFRAELPALIDRAHGLQWGGALKAARPRTSLPRKAKMVARIVLRRLGIRVPGIRGSI